jgi:hypothetical protein
MKENKRLLCQYEGFLDTFNLSPLHSFDIVSFFEFENDKGALLNVTVPEKLVLGKRIERFFSAYIKQSKRYELLKENIQIRKDKITIGELDFLVEDKLLDEVLHIELVYKFYLFVGEYDELSSWIGPNNNDSLIQKIDKLNTKQFPLLKKKETQGVINTLNIDLFKVKQQVFFLGNLFMPYDRSIDNISSVNEKSIVGWWVNKEKFKELGFEHFQFGLPIKQDWIVHPKYNEEWLGYTLFLDNVELMHVQKKSPLCWLDKGNGVYERFFIVWW